MTSCIRRDGFVLGGGNYCPSRLFNAFEPIRILGQTTKENLREKHDSWQAKHVILVTQARAHIGELIERALYNQCNKAARLRNDMMLTKDY